jgi:hypothetical protein
MVVVVVVQSSASSKSSRYQPRADKKSRLYQSIRFFVCTEKSLDIDPYSMHACNRSKNSNDRANEPGGPDREATPCCR